MRRSAEDEAAAAILLAVPIQPRPAAPAAPREAPSLGARAELPQGRPPVEGAARRMDVGSLLGDPAEAIRTGSLQLQPQPLPRGSAPQAGGAAPAAPAAAPAAPMAAEFPAKTIASGGNRFGSRSEGYSERSGCVTYGSSRLCEMRFAMGGLRLPVHDTAKSSRPSNADSHQKPTVAGVVLSRLARTPPASG